ncbi:MAG: damage-control phosphatase ARMT1 family protein [Spirochaetales bacterium]|nr:damage-control phosphatase ARMT1 family protein [Spirochaetales bacterium]
MSEQIMTSKEGSFARFTITDRVPMILQDLISNNDFPPETVEGLNFLLNSVPAGTLKPLKTAYPFAASINKTLAENPSWNWLNGPFLFLENYLYHKIAEICGYYSNGHDYFQYKKEAEARKGVDMFSENLEKIKTIDSFSEICLLNLMGNKADLSQSSSYYSSASSSELLIDHRDRAAEKIGGCSRVDIVLDNAGEELFFDLLLVWWMLTKGGVKKVKLHFKDLPYFVSDALTADYRLLLNILKQRAPWFTEDMKSFENEGRLELSAHPFISGGRLYSGMPAGLTADLSQSSLIIFKGDLNYRRLVGDNYHPCDTETASILTWLPADILISRILKSEVVVGLTPDTTPDRKNTQWMYNGKYGLIEYVTGSKI